MEQKVLLSVLTFLWVLFFMMPPFSVSDAKFLTNCVWSLTFALNWLNLNSNFVSVPPHIPQSAVPVVPYQSQNVSAVMKGKNKFSSGNTMSMIQLPFIPAFASTTYKLQGVTADGLMSYPIIKGSPVPTPFAALYIALSSVRSVNTLVL